MRLLVTQIGHSGEAQIAMVIPRQNIYYKLGPKKVQRSGGRSLMLGLGIQQLPLSMTASTPSDPTTLAVLRCA